MGIFCMVFGVVIFLGFTGGGFLLANALISAPIEPWPERFNGRFHWHSQ